MSGRQMPTEASDERITTEASGKQGEMDRRILSVMMAKRKDDELLTGRGLRGHLVWCRQRRSW